MNILDTSHMLQLAAKKLRHGRIYEFTARRQGISGWFLCRESAGCESHLSEAGLKELLIVKNWEFS